MESQNVAPMASSLPHGPQSAQDLPGAARLAQELYGLQGTASFLPSDRDWNFALQCEDERWVLQIAHAQEDRSSLSFEHAMLTCLAETLGDAVPSVRCCHFLFSLLVWLLLRSRVHPMKRVSGRF